MNALTSILGIKYPVIQAAMAWLTNANLVAAVGEAGGLGVLGPNAGQTTPTHNPMEAAERMRNEIRKVRQQSMMPFAVNFLLPVPEVEASIRYMHPLLDICKEEKVKILVTAGDINHLAKDIFITLKQCGFTILHRDYSPTIKSAIFAQSLGADAYIVTGNEAGGLLPRYELSTLAILPQICNELSIPVIAAGGIIDGVSAHAVQVLGASGIYVGTRFLMSDECPMHINTKNFIKNCNSESLIRVKSAMGDYRSLIPYDYIAHSVEKDVITKTLSSFRIGMLEGKIDEGVVSVSEAAGGIKAIKSVSSIINELATPFI